MSDHYVGVNRGAPGFADSNFTYGTSTGATDIEIRIADAAGWSRKEIIVALEQFEAFFTQRSNIAGVNFPPG